MRCDHSTLTIITAMFCTEQESFKKPLLGYRNPTISLQCIEKAVKLAPTLSKLAQVMLHFNTSSQDRDGLKRAQLPVLQKYSQQFK